MLKIFFDLWEHTCCSTLRSLLSIYLMLFCSNTNRFESLPCSHLGPILGPEKALWRILTMVSWNILLAFCDVLGNRPQLPEIQLHSDIHAHSKDKQQTQNIFLPATDSWRILLCFSLQVTLNWELIRLWKAEPKQKNKT